MIKTVAFMSVQPSTLEQKLSHKYFNNMNCFPPPTRTNPDGNWICKLRVDGRQSASPSSGLQQAGAVGTHRSLTTNSDITGSFTLLRIEG